MLKQFKNILLSNLREMYLEGNIIKLKIVNDWHPVLINFYNFLIICMLIGYSFFSDK